ncbi:hypothetical protein ACO2I3_08850 [Leptospira interrogans]
MLRKLKSKLAGKRGQDKTSSANTLPAASQQGSSSAEAVSKQCGSSGEPALGRCAHNRLSCCPDCVAAGDETRRIESLPGPIYRDADDLALDVIKSLKEENRFEPVAHDEVYERHRELCAHNNIKTLTRDKLLHALGKRLETTRLPPTRPNDKRKTVKCYIVPKPASELAARVEWLFCNAPPFPSRLLKALANKLT